MIVTLKINGKEIQADTSKFHESWLDKCLAYGVRRLPNDSFSGEKGDTKFDLVKGMIEDMEKGEPAPERIAVGRVSTNPVETLALKNAKADLTVMFRAITNGTKAIDYARHEKVAPFFVVTEDRAVWNDKTVLQWIAKQAEAGKRDHMKEAAYVIESTKATEDVLGDLAL